MSLAVLTGTLISLISAAVSLGVYLLAVRAKDAKIERLQNQVDMLKLHKRMPEPQVGEVYNPMAGDILTITGPTEFEALITCALRRTQ